MTAVQRIKVLVVEDNPLDMRTLQDYFAEVPHVEFLLHHVERLQGALDFLQSDSCDVILLDLGLPDSQGLDTLTRLHARAPETPVLVLTGLNDEAISLKALQNGAQDYFVKNQIQAPLLGKAIRYAIERHQMERLVMRAEKLQAMGTLSGGIAHDFNNILLVVSGNTKLALEQLAPDHPAYPYLLEIAKAGSRAVALTKKIRTFSQQQEIHRGPLQLGPVVEEALSLLRAGLPARFKIQNNLPPGLPAVLADPSQLQQAIINLATNAAEALGDRPGNLEISASPIHLNGNGVTLSSKLPPGDYIKISVKDTGPGMDKSTLSRAFEPFFTTKTQGRGTGMGLAIVHGIMKNHLGEVTAYSEVGKGTVFNLYFPVAEELPVSLPLGTPAPAGQGQHILYVDDEEPLVLLITRILKRLGYQVTGFTNPLEALHVLRHDPCGFHAIVTDFSMPQMSGTDFAQEALQVCPRIPVILTTGYIRPQDQELARNVGVRQVILKPDTVEELGNVLHQLFSDSCVPPHAEAARTDSAAG